MFQLNMLWFDDTQHQVISWTTIDQVPSSKVEPPGANKVITILLQIIYKIQKSRMSEPCQVSILFYQVLF